MSCIFFISNCVFKSMRRENLIINILLRGILCLPLFFIDGCTTDGGGFGTSYAEIGTVEWLPDQSGFIVMADKRSGWVGNIAMPIDYPVLTSPLPLNYSFYKLDTKGKILETLFESPIGNSYRPPFYLSQDGLSILCTNSYRVLQYSLLNKKSVFIDSMTSIMAVSPNHKFIVLGKWNNSSADSEVYNIEDISGSEKRTVATIKGFFSPGLWLTQSRIALLQYENSSTRNLVIYDTLWNLKYTKPFKGGSLKYSPSTDELFFVEDATLKKMTLATGVVTTIIQAGNFVADFSVSSDGLFIIYKDESKKNIQIVNLVSGAVAAIHNQFADRFVISPDSRKIVWVAYPSSDANPFSVQDIVVP